MLLLTKKLHALKSLLLSAVFSRLSGSVWTNISSYYLINSRLKCALLFFPPPKIYLRVVDTPLRNLCNFFFLTFVKNSPSCMTDGLKCSSLAQQVTAVIHSCWKGNHFNRFVLLKWLPVSASVQPNAPPPPTTPHPPASELLCATTTKNAFHFKVWLCLSHQGVINVNVKYFGPVLLNYGP